MLQFFHKKVTKEVFMEKKVVRKKKNIKKHIVVFQDHEGNVVNTVFVNDGDSVDPPVLVELLREGDHEKTVFDHWDQNLTSIHENIVAKPVYIVKPKEYLVMYFHENGKILGTETVPYGNSASSPYIPVKEETDEFTYHFTGWNQDLSFIEKDCMVKACFEEKRKKFPVKFFGDGNVLLKEEMVEYGTSAVAPEQVEKASDKTYHYSFQKWDEDFSSIIREKEIHAVFQAEYIPYKISFFEENQLIESKVYHYNDLITYPTLIRKGYEFIWESVIDHVKEEKTIRGHWQFSNIKGKKIENETGLYEVINPSIISGQVRLITFYENTETVKIPDQVKLGDYYYNVTSIGTNAFVKCKNTKKIICGNKVKTLEKNCFEGCRKVEEIILGKNVSELKEEIFSKCAHLKVLKINNSKLPKVYRNTFEGMNRRVCLYVPKSVSEQYSLLLSRAIREKNLFLQKM